MGCIELQPIFYINPIQVELLKLNLNELHSLYE